VDRLQAQLSDMIISPSPIRMSTKGAGTRSVHHHRHASLPRELPGRREMVGVGVGVDQVADAQAVTGGERNIVVDLADFRIDQRRTAATGLAAADQVRLAAASGDLFDQRRLCGAWH
jgi:hypothetical protein